MNNNSITPPFTKKGMSDGSKVVCCLGCAVILFIATILVGVGVYLTYSQSDDFNLEEFFGLETEESINSTYLEDGNVAEEEKKIEKGPGIKVVP